MSSSPQIFSHVIWNDPEINIRIFAQLCHLQYDQILEKPLSDRFFRYSECVMHKLHATRHHVEIYARLEQAHFERCTEQFTSGDLNTYECFDLIFEFEAFLYQIKSSLDMLVKIMIPVLGKRVKTQTFAAKGDTLVRGLRQYLKDGSAQKEKVEEFIKMLEWAKTDWIEKVVDFRDELNHHRGLTHYMFSPEKLSSGKIVAVKPKFKNLDTLDFMIDIYGRNLVFHQDFMCFALSLIAPPPFVLTMENNIANVASFGDLAQCIKWGWGMKLPTF